MIRGGGGAGGGVGGGGMRMCIPYYKDTDALLYGNMAHCTCMSMTWVPFAYRKLQQTVCQVSCYPWVMVTIMCHEVGSPGGVLRAPACHLHIILLQVGGPASSHCRQRQEKAGRAPSHYPALITRPGMVYIHTGRVVI